jgi:ribose-phosphate pyrophosphokinase
LSENCRGHDIYVMQSGGGESPNDNLMELLFLVNAFRLAAARKITVITPYFPYR